MFPRAHRFTLAILLSSPVWLVLARVLDVWQLQIGLPVHLALAIAVGVCTSIVQQSRRASASEAAGVAHDLRGPLVTLQATLELLAGDGFGSLPEAARAAALRAAATSGRAADVVECTLRHAVNGTAAAPLRGITDLDLVWRETLDALDVQVRTSGATVRAAPLPRVAGDSSALFRVFVNLLQNGLKYHQPDVLPLVTVTAATEGAWTVISVSDEGIGIAPDERSRVFERHYRTAAGTARADGEGLGLATVQRLVTGMGGTIWVDAAVQRGTTIRFRLPLA